MAEKIAISRAIKLANVSRREFQKLIKSGQLETFEGKVDADALKAVFPTINVELDSVFKDLDFIRKAAYSNRVQSRLIPTRGDVVNQLEKTRMRLLVEKQKAAAYSKTMEALLQYMSKLRVNASESEIKIIDELGEWLTHQLEEVD